MAEAPEQRVLGWLRGWEGLWHFLIHRGRKKDVRKLTLLSKMATNRPRQVLLFSKKRGYFRLSVINLK